MRRAAPLLIALLLAGCGSSGGTETARIGSAPSPNLTAFKRAYLAERPALNAIILEIDRAVRTNPSDKQLATRFRALADKIAAMLRKLVVIPLPAEMALPFGQVIGGLGRVEGDLRALSDALGHRLLPLAQSDTQALVAELDRLRGPAATLRVRLGVASAPG